MSLIITTETKNTVQVLPYCDPGEYPAWDLHGYDIAYYIVTPAVDHITGEYHTHTNGDIMVRDHSGDALCGTCATEWANTGDLLQADEALGVAYQINGEVGDMEPVYCDHCGEVIYKPDND